MTLAMEPGLLWLLVIGLGLFMIGIPPGAEEISRSFLFLVTIIFSGVWLALAMLFRSCFYWRRRRRWSHWACGFSSPSFGRCVAGAVAQLRRIRRYIAIGMAAALAGMMQAFARLSPDAVRGDGGGLA